MITHSFWKDFIEDELCEKGRITHLTVAFLIFISVFTVVIDAVLSLFELIIYFITKKLNKKYKR